jgi:cell wall-associated NlpC family hydrolase
MKSSGLNLNSIRIFILLIISLTLSSCGSRKPLAPSAHETDIQPLLEETFYSVDSPKYNYNEELSTATGTSEEDLMSRITKYAQDFLGTGYKYGGTGPDGMDCSGLVLTAFSMEEIQLPRTSREMATMGDKIALSQVSSGDLLFFQTNPRKSSITHVGLVVEVLDQNIHFIHSTTSQGVIISSLTEKYWQDHFVMARRIQ